MERSEESRAKLPCYQEEQAALSEEVVLRILDHRRALDMVLRSDQGVRPKGVVTVR